MSPFFQGVCLHTSTVHACAAAELGTPTWRSSPSLSRAASNLNVLDGQAGRQRLLQLVGLLEVLHAQGVQVFAAAHLELHDVLRLLDLNGCGERAGTGSCQQGCRKRWRMARGVEAQQHERSPTMGRDAFAAVGRATRRAMLQHLALIESWLRGSQTLATASDRIDLSPGRYRAEKRGGRTQ